jgi:Zn-dependent protease
MDLITLILLAIVLVLSIGFHEYAHALVSYKLWDPTPKLQWRLTPNPLKHLDLLWFLMIFLINFGWWKPVEVNPMYYKNKLRDELLVALAGPFTNFLMALVGWAIFVLLDKFWMLNPLMVQFFQLFIFVNLALAIFNLLPIYPLDWYRIIKFLKPSWAQFMEQNALIFSIILLILIFMPWNLIGKIINLFVEPLYNLIILLWQSIFF